MNFEGVPQEETVPIEGEKDERGPYAPEAVFETRWGQKEYQTLEEKKVALEKLNELMSNLDEESRLFEEAKKEREKFMGSIDEPEGQRLDHVERHHKKNAGEIREQIAKLATMGHNDQLSGDLLDRWKKMLEKEIQEESE